MPETFTGTTPLGFIGKAEAYRRGAQLLARDLKSPGGWAGDPTRYLYYHCIELYLKAALIAAGRNETQLREIGHGFSKLVKACNRVGLGLREPDDLAVIKMIDADRNYIRTRYHYVGAFRTVTIQALDGTAYEVALLTVEMVRRSGKRLRAPSPALPIEFRFQVG